MSNKYISTLHYFLALLVTISNFACKKENIAPATPPVTFKDYQFEEPQFSGNTFYVDPANGSSEGDGSEGNPWRTLQEVFESNLIRFYKFSENNNINSAWELVNGDAPIKGGDKIILRSGYHGYVQQNAFMFKEWLTIEGQEGHTPILSQFQLIGTFQNVYLKNFSVIKESFQGEGNYWDSEAINKNNGACLALESSDFWGKGSFAKINGLTIKTAEDISAWNAEEWVQKASTGINLRAAKNIEIVNSTIENIRFGIVLEFYSDSSKIVNNTINNYSGDGARIISNDVFFAYNTITNCFKVDDNHDDAIQSYTRGANNSPGTGVLKNVVVRGNLIIGKTSDYPLAGNPQGIGCFDGMYDNWTIENNVVLTDHYHGITFMGMTNGKVVNNTVVDLSDNNELSPWIRVVADKSGEDSWNCLVANNIASSAIIAEGFDVVDTANYVIGKRSFAQIFELFVDPTNFDMHLAINSFTKGKIINKGGKFRELVSFRFDKDNLKRQGNPDLGAYESK